MRTDEINIEIKGFYLTTFGEKSLAFYNNLSLARILEMEGGGIQKIECQLLFFR